MGHNLYHPILVQKQHVIYSRLLCAGIYSVMWRGVCTCASLYISVYGLYHQTDINYLWYNPNLCHICI